MLFHCRIDVYHKKPSLTYTRSTLTPHPSVQNISKTRQILAKTHSANEASTEGTTGNQNSNRKINRFIYYMPTHNSSTHVTIPFRFVPFDYIVIGGNSYTNMLFNFSYCLCSHRSALPFFLCVCIETIDNIFCFRVGKIGPARDGKKMCVLIFRFVRSVKSDKHIDGTKSSYFKFIWSFS